MPLKKSPVRVPRKSDDSEQSRFFIKKAHEIEADEENSAADELLGHLHKKPPKPRKKPHSI
jgi:hypothetical protein